MLSVPDVLAAFSDYAATSGVDGERRQAEERAESEREIVRWQAAAREFADSAIPPH